MRFDRIEVRHDSHAFNGVADIVADMWMLGKVFAVEIAKRKGNR